MTNSENVLSYKCRSLSNCGTNKTVDGNFWLLGGREAIHGGCMHGVPEREGGRGKQRRCTHGLPCDLIVLAYSLLQQSPQCYQLLYLLSNLRWCDFTVLLKQLLVTVVSAGRRHISLSVGMIPVSFHSSQLFKFIPVSP